RRWRRQQHPFRHTRQNPGHPKHILLIHINHPLPISFHPLRNHRPFHRPKRLRSPSSRLLNPLTIRRVRSRKPPSRVVKVQASRTPPQSQSRHVVSPRSHFRRGVSSQPYPRLLLRLPDLRHPLPAGFPPSPDSMVHRVTCLPELLPPRWPLRNPRCQVLYLVH
ncbi:hypothetical protein LINGRAHAP2_LOCUS22113, partial [Linum grandiflorum]